MKKVSTTTETVDIELPSGQSAAFTRTERIEEFQINPAPLIALTFVICFALAFGFARLIQVRNYETHQQQFRSQYENH